MKKSKDTIENINPMNNTNKRKITRKCKQTNKQPENEKN